ncbi:MAG: penicillin acylase family protein [Halioglobus sp.]
MITTRSTVLKLSWLALGAVLLAACSDSSDDPLNPLPVERYNADIVWTQYGVPHITADDYGSLGYGAGYVYARENFCTLMREYVRAAGDSARYLGDDGNLNEDLVMKLYNSDTAVQRMIDEDLPAYVVENLTGYAAGVNRYWRETGVENLAQGEEGCRGAAWAREVTLNDVVRLIHRTVLRASGLPLADFIVAAQPDLPMAQLTLPAGATREQYVAASVRQTDFAAGLNLPTGGELGSNAYAIGEQASQTDSGVLFGNPHFPWQGQERFFMFHLTMPGEYDAMGAALGGLPAPVIAFNRDVAWSHTVSTGDRFTFYELTLNPENPMQYVYDGEMRDITSQTVTAERLGEGGAVETVEHTFYFSHYGAIVDLGNLNSLLAGWPNALGTVLAYRDGNLENLRGLNQWINMGKARNLGEFKEALRDLGIPWVNTIAADRNGDAFYGDISVVPHVSAAKQQNCVRGLVQATLTDNGFPTLDGSDSDCEWGSDEGTAEGIFGYDSLPKLETREYGANANDSYWLSNPRSLLEGFPPIIGRERVEQSVRTRHTFSQAERRIAGTDGLGEPGFNVDNIRQLSYQATNHAAELVLNDLLTVCESIPDDPMAGISLTQQACEILAAWDGAHRTDSVGGHIFYEFWLAARSTPNFWATPFDPADPVNTPRDLNIADATVAAAMVAALDSAVERLSAAGIPLDRPWGEVQFDEKNGTRFGIHGGSGSMMFSVITSGLVDGEGYADIRHGNSYMHAVSWDSTDCPDAYNIITYSQSTDPASAHYADMTELYSNGGWIDAAFCADDIAAQEIARQTISE